MKKVLFLVRTLCGKERVKQLFPQIKRSSCLISHYDVVIRKACLQLLVFHFAASAINKQGYKPFLRPEILRMYADPSETPSKSFSAFPQMRLLQLPAQAYPAKALSEAIPLKKDFVRKAYMEPMKKKKDFMEKPTKHTLVGKQSMTTLTKSQLFKLLTTPACKTKGDKMEGLPFNLAAILMKMRFSQAPPYQNFMSIVNQGLRKEHLDKPQENVGGLAREEKVKKNKRQGDEVEEE